MRTQQRTNIKFEYRCGRMQYTGLNLICVVGVGLCNIGFKFFNICGVVGACNAPLRFYHKQVNLHG
jgi:hypothetical protein